VLKAAYFTYVGFNATQEANQKTSNVVQVIEFAILSCRLIQKKDNVMKKDAILLDHGSGGKMAHSLTTDMLLPLFDNPILSQLNDGAIFDVNGVRLAFSTDTFTVDPLFFPGGNIGELAVNGTVNDVAMCGAIPLYLSMGLIIEEGFLRQDLEKILVSMQRATQKAGVKLITGDTKVVPRGAADRIFINTSGIGVIPDGVQISGDRAQTGDAVILSGYMADHGITVLTQREGMQFDSTVKSDSAALNHMVKKMLACSDRVHVLRDPTRGGVGTTLNEIAEQSNIGIHIKEEQIPVRPEVAGICELLGFDPLYLANEGKLLAFVAPAHAKKVLSCMQADEFGKDARIIGEVKADHPGRVHMKTCIGGERIIDMLTGEQLPRIC
jgi:hydrogenase expression/formation protein HypE